MRVVRLPLIWPTLPGADAALTVPAGVAVAVRVGVGDLVAVRVLVAATTPAQVLGDQSPRCALRALDWAAL